jgi:hypothetical protein
MFKDDTKFNKFLELDKELLEFKKALPLIETLNEWNLAKTAQSELSFYVNAKLKSLGL